MEIVNYEIVKKLKEKGFREKCIWHYYDDTKDKYMSSVPQCYNYGGNTSDAPTISQVLKWLREEKNVSFSIFLHCSLKWVQDIRVFGEGLFMDYTPYLDVIDVANDTFYTLYDSYEEAAFAGIEYILDEII